MNQVVKVEDVANITGMDAYIASLHLKREALSYTGMMQDENHLAILNFKYTEEKEVLLLKIGMNQKHDFIYFYCSCPHFQKDKMCGHVALLVRYLLEDYTFTNQVLSTLPDLHDHLFNHKLFTRLKQEEKELLPLTVILKHEVRYDYTSYYQLQLKLGEKQQYLLNPHLTLFLEGYHNPGFMLPFGKQFVYDEGKYRFSKEDEAIFSFLKIYYGKSTFHEMGNHQIILTDELLSLFLPLLKNHPFILEQDYFPISYSGIKEHFPFVASLDVYQETGIELSYEKPTITKLTLDYRYVIYENAVYHLTKEEALLLSMFLEKEGSSVIFEEQEIPQFLQLLYPKLKASSPHIHLTDQLKSRFVEEKGRIKCYLDAIESGLSMKVEVEYLDTNINILSQDQSVNGVFLLRDVERETECRQNMLQYGFRIDMKEMRWILEDSNAIASFLETGLDEFCKHYTVLVSKRVKQRQVYQVDGIKSRFELGRENILSYEFSVPHIEKEEMAKFIDAIRDKKQYYELKDGSFLSLKNSQVQSFVDMLDCLEVGTHELANGVKEIPTYQMFALEPKLLEEEFVEISLPVQELITNFKAYQNMPIVIPENKHVKIRDYQVTGIKWMKMISNCGFGGILADEMGLGKSLQTIEYIKLQLNEDRDRKFLIVVPTSLVYNWENEFHKFAPSLRFQVINGLPQERVKYLEHLRDYEVIITTYGLLRQDISYYETIQFDTCVIDEAQNIKNITTQNTKTVKQIHSRVKFALTGTPIENSLLELWSIFDFIMPGFLKSSRLFKEKYNLKKIEEDESILKLLQYQISPFIMRRKKIDVLKDLPEKIENTVYIDLTMEQKQLYLAYLEKTKNEIDEAITKEGYKKSQILILSLLTKLRQICIEPRLVVEDYKGDNAKLSHLMDMVKAISTNGHKILLFSQFPSALQYVKTALDQAHLSYYYLDGSTKSKERMRLVDAFNQDQTQVFLISLKAGGTGLNLTSADVVIHLDPWWNPQVENQATDRTHRIGQTNVVEVIKMITKGTIEEKILELQSKKKRLSENVIDGNHQGEFTLSKLTEDELRNLLTIS